MTLRRQCLYKDTYRQMTQHPIAFKSPQNISSTLLIFTTSLNIAYIVFIFFMKKVYFLLILCDCVPLYLPRSSHKWKHESVFRSPKFVIKRRGIFPLRVERKIRQQLCGRLDNVTFNQSENHHTTIIFHRLKVLESNCMHIVSCINHHCFSTGLWHIHSRTLLWFAHERLVLPIFFLKTFSCFACVLA